MKTVLKIIIQLLLMTSMFGCASKHIHTSERTKVSNRYTEASPSLYYLAKDDVLKHAPQTGFYSLEHNYDAFSARIALIEEAKHTLDLQYFIFAEDEVSVAVVQRLLAAADRGVHVRILLDDLLQNGYDKTIASLAQHPDIEIKLFNPTSFRDLLGWVQLAFNVDTLGRRMHNKLLVADNSALILGGRNIENLYFALDNDRIFIDHDILAIGPLSAQASNSFETYWESPISVPIEALSEHQELYDLSEIGEEIDALVKEYEASAYVADVMERPFAKALTAHELPLIYGDANIYYDIPSKVTASEEETDTHLSEHLLPIVRNASKSIIIVNPYFMPNDQMLEEIKRLIAKGVEITVVTNSLATNDAIGVYASYSTYHKQLLQLGVTLYELSPYSFEHIYKDQEFRKGKVPRSSLHAKTMLIDDDIFIIGSANLDPRSSKLNTEVVAVIDSKALVTYEKKVFNVLIQEDNVYRLSLEKGEKMECLVTCVPKDGWRVVWETREKGQWVKYYDDDADAGFYRRFISNISRWIPLEKYL